MEVPQLGSRSYAIWIALALLGNFENGYVWGAPNGNTVCNTEVCKNLAARYQKYMDHNVSPCNDFYNYVCGAGVNSTDIPQHKIGWALEYEMTEKVSNTMKGLLLDPKVSKDVQKERAKSLYKACLKLPFMEKCSSDIVKNIMSRVGNWPMFLPAKDDLPKQISWWEIDNEYVKKTGESALFDTNLICDSYRDNRITPQISSLTSPYGILQRVAGWGMFSSERSYYKSFLYKIVESVAPQDPSPFKRDINKNLDDVIEFRENLRSILSNPNTPKVFNVVPLEQFQNVYNTQAKNNAQVNWLEKFKAIYRNGLDPYGSEVKVTSLVSVEIEYLFKLAKLLGRTPKNTIVNHIHVYFAERHVQLTTKMEEDLMYSFNVGALRNLPARSQWCVNHHNMKGTLSRMYIDVAFPPALKAQTEKYFDELKSVMQKQIAESTWLDNPTKLNAIKKVKNMQRSIGYPEWLKSPPKSVVADPYDIEPLSLNAYYALDKNRMYFSASFLQPPVFNPGAPYVIHCGTPLSKFAHEMYHAFSGTGYHYDHSGNATEWPQSMSRIIKEQSQCFDAQYKRYKTAELKKYTILYPLLQFPSSLEEDIADAMGLKLAYRLFKEKQTASKNPCPILPGFKDMNCDKLFFISFAHSLCTTSTIASEAMYVLTAKHSPHKIRVNGAVANMKEFSQAFNCKPADPLNLKQRCDLWKN